MNSDRAGQTEDLERLALLRGKGMAMKHFCSFSEAIREGAKLRPQATQLFVKLRSGSVGSCAIGAGYEAITGSTTSTICHEVYETVATLYPYMKDGALRTCPVDDCGEHELQGLEEAVLHLNDSHRWTREKIADWLESEEEKLGFVTLVENEASITSEAKALVTA